MTLKLKKCQLTQHEVKLIGLIVSLGRKRADPNRVAAVQDLKILETIKEAS